MLEPIPIWSVAFWVFVPTSIKWKITQRINYLQFSSSISLQDIYVLNLETTFWRKQDLTPEPAASHAAVLTEKLDSFIQLGIYFTQWLGCRKSKNNRSLDRRFDSYSVTRRLPFNHMVVWYQICLAVEDLTQPASFHSPGSLQWRLFTSRTLLL